MKSSLAEVTSQAEVLVICKKQREFEAAAVNADGN